MYFLNAKRLCYLQDFLSAMWYHEEIENAVRFLATEVAKTYYGGEKLPQPRRLRQGNPSKDTHHDPTRCQACMEGLCVVRFWSIRIDRHLEFFFFYSICSACDVMCLVWRIFFYFNGGSIFFVPIVYSLVWLLVYRTNTNGDSFFKINKRVVSLKRKKWFSLNQSLVHDS